MLIQNNAPEKENHKQYTKGIKELNLDGIRMKKCTLKQKKYKEWKLDNNGSNSFIELFFDWCTEGNELCHINFIVWIIFSVKKCINISTLYNQSKK